MMKKFINDPYDVVDEMVEAFVQVHSRYIHKLEGVRTLVRNNMPQTGISGVAPDTNLRS